jgi:hypothetical protein
MISATRLVVATTRASTEKTQTVTQQLQSGGSSAQEAAKDGLRVIPCEFGARALQQHCQDVVVGHERCEDVAADMVVYRRQGDIPLLQEMDALHSSQFGLPIHMPIREFEPIPTCQSRHLHRLCPVRSGPFA